MENVKKILGFDFNANAFARRAPQPINISTQNLAMLKEIVEKHGDTGHKRPEPEELRQIYHLFLDTPPSKFRLVFDTLKRVRRLAWALTYSENQLPRIVDTPQLRDALGLIEERFRISALLGVFDALLQAWETTPNTRMLREFVKRHTNNYDGSRKFVQKLKANLAWYCEADGARTLVRTLSNFQKKLSDVWDFLELPNYTRSYRYFGAIAEAFVSSNPNPEREAINDIVHFVEKHNNDETSRAVLSKIIEKLGIEASDSVRQPVQSYVLRKWQDPRIAGADVRWRNVSDEARRIFTRWITKEDLRFFFDVVAKACDDEKFEYRKAFWLAYLEHISFCRPVLRQNVVSLFTNDRQILQYYLERRPAKLIGGSSNQHAFIIQMGSHTFVEFSTAAACYVYVDTERPFRLDDSTYHMAELRSRPWAEHRVVHQNSGNYHWQHGFAYWIKNNLGIEPVRSYRLNTENETNDITANNPHQEIWIASTEVETETDGIAKLISELGAKGRGNWLEAADALVEIGEPAVPVLIEALHDEEPRVRNRAIYILGQLGESALAAIPALRERLNDPVDYVSQQASNVLKRLETFLGREPSQNDQPEEPVNAAHTHVRCSNKSCRQMLRLPETKGLLRITCPTCQTTFEHETR